MTTTRRTALALFAATAGLLLTACGTTAPPSVPFTVTDPAPTVTVTRAPAAPVNTPTPEPVLGSLSTHNVTLTVKITSKECFGSAGCVLTYKASPKTSANLPLDGTYDVTYSIRGGEDGPIDGSFTVADDGSISDDWNLTGVISTTSRNSKITAKVLTVDFMGGDV